VLRKLRQLVKPIRRGSDRRFEFQKRRQYFIGVHNEPLSVAAMRVNNPNRSPLTIQSRDPAQTPTGLW
jgi:hypothetical protein